MSGAIVAFLCAIGGAAWIYAHFMRTTGSNTKNSLMAAAAVGIIIFIAVVVIFSFIA